MFYPSNNAGVRRKRASGWGRDARAEAEGARRFCPATGEIRQRGGQRASLMPRKARQRAKVLCDKYWNQILRFAQNDNLPLTYLPR